MSHSSLYNVRRDMGSAFSGRGRRGRIEGLRMVGGFRTGDASRRLLDVASSDLCSICYHFREGREVLVVEVRRHLEVVGEAEDLVRVREVERRRAYLRQFTCQRALTLDWNQDTGTPMATHVWRKSAFCSTV